jgi:hypothetical protein
MSHSMAQSGYDQHTHAAGSNRPSPPVQHCTAAAQRKAAARPVQDALDKKQHRHMQCLLSCRSSSCVACPDVSGPALSPLAGPWGLDPNLESLRPLQHPYLKYIVLKAVWPSDHTLLPYR